MDRKRFDTSERSSSNTSLCGASRQNDLPSVSIEGESFCSASSSGDLSEITPTGKTNLPDTWPTKIREWTDEANISFKYTKTKTKQSVREAKHKMQKREAKKMAEESGCNHLECTQCKVSFPSEAGLRKHYDSDEHLAKVRVRSERKTLGDLKIFANASEDIYNRQTRAYLADREAKAANQKIKMAKQSGSNRLECDLFYSESKFITHHGSEEHLVSAPLECNLNQESFQSMAELREHSDSDNEESPGLPAATAAATNVLGETFWDLSHGDVTYDDFLVGGDMNDIGDATGVTEESRASDITKLQEEVDRLKSENNKLEEQNKKNEEKILRLKRIDEETSPKSLQNIVLHLKKNDEGYDFDDAKYYRMMSVLDRPCFSVREIVTKLISCSFKINRICGNYGERPNKRGGLEEDEENPRKRKR